MYSSAIAPKLLADAALILSSFFTERRVYTGGDLLLDLAALLARLLERDCRKGP
jgi:hypothetical protein